MAKLTGYILAIIGLIIVILSLNTGKLSIPAAIKPAYIMILGLVLVIFGILLVLGKGKSKQAAEEVPIYKGKQIVGYRRAE